MIDNGDPCKECGSTDTVVSIEGFTLSVVGSNSSPTPTHYLNCLDCGEKTPESIKETNNVKKLEGKP